MPFYFLNFWYFDTWGLLTLGAQLPRGLETEDACLQVRL